MKLSVLMITYDHEKFIVQALDSVLMQEVNFDYEIVIGEDCSTDATRNILVEYQKKYPDIIRLLLPEKNLGMHRNFVETYHTCRGEYVALLEGDDYWTSPRKLQKQVEFLDAHPDCATCFHAATAKNEQNPGKSFEIRPYQGNTVFTIEDLLRDNIIPTCSALFRSGLTKTFPPWIFDLCQMDWPLHILNSQHGDIGYLDECMSVYRIHQGGVWNRESDASRVGYIIKAYTAINSHLDFKYDTLIKNRILKQTVDLVRVYTEAGDTIKARRVLKTIESDFPIQNEFMQEIRHMKNKLYWPTVHTLNVNLRHILETGFGKIFKAVR